MNAFAKLSVALFATTALALPAHAQYSGFKAAITKQVSPLNAGENAIVELNTYIPMPHQLQLQTLVTPPGAVFKDARTSATCPDARDARRCRQYFTFAIDAHSSGKCNLNGDYVAKFQVACLPGGANCKPGQHEIAFSLKSENFCAERVVDTSGHWTQRASDFFAADVGAGGTDWMWLLDAKKKVPGGFDAITLGFDKNAAMRRNGGAVRVDVDALGGAFVANDRGEMYRFDSSTGRWSKMTGFADDGQATDVGVGANGTAWYIGTKAVPGGHGIYRWQTDKWVNVPGGAVRIDVDPQGYAWVINNAGDVFRFDGARFVPVPGAKARDVGIGANGAVFVAGQDGSAYKWGGGVWAKRGGSRLTDITVTAQGVPIAIDENRVVWVGQP